MVLSSERSFCKPRGEAGYAKLDLAAEKNHLICIDQALNKIEQFLVCSGAALKATEPRSRNNLGLAELLLADLPSIS